jgi:hypothetical protein
VISHSFAFSASRHLSILVSMLDLSPPLPVFLLLRVGGLSRLNTQAVLDVQSLCTVGCDTDRCLVMANVREIESNQTFHRCHGEIQSQEVK